MMKRKFSSLLITLLLLLDYLSVLLYLGNPVAKFIDWEFFAFGFPIIIFPLLYIATTILVIGFRKDVKKWQVMSFYPFAFFLLIYIFRLAFGY